MQELTGGDSIRQLADTGITVDEYFARTDAVGSVNYLRGRFGKHRSVDGYGWNRTKTAYTYEPFGKTTVSGAATSSNFTFTGRESDATGVEFYRARFYDQTATLHQRRSVGQFVAAIQNVYSYVGNSPQQFTDPLGLCIPIPPVAISCIPPIVVLTGEALGWLAATGAGVLDRQRVVGLVHQPLVYTSDLGGQDKGYRSDKGSRGRYLEEARDVMRDPNSTAKEGWQQRRDWKR